MRQNLLEMSLIPIAPATPVEKTTQDAVKFCWSKDASTALLEEVINSGAHRPPYGQVERLWKEVQEAMAQRGYVFSQHRTLQRQYNKLLADFKKQSAKNISTSGVEDEEEDEMTSLLEDISQEVLDFEVEKEKKKADKESTEAALVAGGASLHDKAATMVLNGEKVRIGGPAVDLTTVGRASLLFPFFGSSLTDGSVTSASTST